MRSRGAVPNRLATMSETQLSGRGAAVLDAIVERFILTGEPVGSGTIADVLPERVSSATIRNVMAELEHRGFLEQPHTSAGRMPTARGYRHYVAGLRVDARFEPVDERRLRAEIDGTADLRDLLERTCRLLAELSHLVGLVSTPPMAETVFQHIDFVALEGNRVLAIVVGRNGEVSNRIVTLADPAEQEQLDRAGQYLVRRFAGRSLDEVAERLRALASRASERLEALELRALELGALAFPTDLRASEVIVEGTASLLLRPEFADRTHDLQAIIDTLERRRDLAPALDPTTDPAGPRVVIGAEPLPETLGSCSLIAATYWSGDSALGSVAILGPTRLPYARAIALVDAVARVTSTMFGRIRH